MFKNQKYEAVAAGLKETREIVTAAFEDGTVAQSTALAALDTATEKVADRLKAAHHGDYPFRTSRFLKAAGMDA